MNDSSADWLYQTLLFADDNLLRPPRLPPGVILPVEAARGLLCFLDPKGLEVSQIEADWEPHRGASHRWRRGGKQPLPDRLVGEGCHGLNLGEASPHPCREQAPDRSAQPRAGPTSSFLMILVAHLQSITTTVAWRIAISSVGRLVLPCPLLCCYTLFEIFIFCPKIQLWFPEKIVDFFGVKNSWKCCGFGLFCCWQLWFHEKNCQT